MSDELYYSKYLKYKKKYYELKKQVGGVIFDSEWQYRKLNEPSLAIKENKVYKSWNLNLNITYVKYLWKLMHERLIDVRNIYKSTLKNKKYIDIINKSIRTIINANKLLQSKKQQTHAKIIQSQENINRLLIPLGFTESQFHQDDYILKYNNIIPKLNYIITKKNQNKYDKIEHDYYTALEKCNIYELFVQINKNFIEYKNIYDTLQKGDSVLNNSEDILNLITRIMIFLDTIMQDIQKECKTTYSPEEIKVSEIWGPIIDSINKTITDFRQKQIEYAHKQKHHTPPAEVIERELHMAMREHHPGIVNRSGLGMN